MQRTRRPIVSPRPVRRIRWSVGRLTTSKPALGSISPLSPLILCRVHRICGPGSHGRLCWRQAASWTCLAGPSAVCSERVDGAKPTIQDIGLPPTRVVAESGDGQLYLEGEIVGGVRDEDGGWDLDGTFTVRTDDGELVRVNGWCCFVEVQA